MREEKNLISSNNEKIYKTHEERVHPTIESRVFELAGSSLRGIIASEYRIEFLKYYQNYTRKAEKVRKKQNVSLVNIIE